ncbi:unnamed protein product [Clonostachys solani]|uniref:Major facilitator superfamily (MFS) profile domain-containing protein n=1 Tax=Clonostachys solani TaxID=160281 RepID=A0A9N9W5X7_9HYPO|nr:unnamed protein product [Clonostachys solani]
MSKPEASETVREEASEPTPSPTEDATEGTIEDVDWKIGKQELTILLTMSFLCIAVALDASILVPALPTLAKELNGSAIETFWAGTSYLLSNAVFLPFLGALSEVFGRRALLLASLFMFTVGTIICCTANGFPQLLTGRTVQGVGGGGLMTMALVITTDVIPLRQRPKYQTIISAAFGLGGVFGPLTGGLIAEHTTWRWLFYVNFPFCAVGFLITPFTIRLKPERKLTIRQALWQIDWLGGALFIAGISSFLLGLTWGGVQYSWGSYKSWLPILLGGLVVALSLFYEAKVPKMPFMRLRVFNSLSAGIIFFSTAIQGFILYSQLYYLPFYFTSVKGASTTLAGIFIMAVNIILFPVSIGAGLVMTRRGTYRWSINVGFIIMTLGNGLLVYLDQHKSVVQHLFIFLLSGIGHGFLLGSLNYANQATAKAQDVSFAVSMFTFMRAFGICIGVAVGGTVFSNLLLPALRDGGATPEQAQSITENSEAFVHILNEMPDNETKQALITAYVEAFRGIFYVLTALSALCTVLSFMTKQFNMNVAMQSGHHLTKKGQEGSEKDMEQGTAKA